MTVEKLYQLEATLIHRNHSPRQNRIFLQNKVINVYILHEMLR